MRASQSQGSTWHSHQHSTPELIVGGSERKYSHVLSSKLETVIRSGSGGKSMKEHHIELTRTKGSPIHEWRPSQKHHINLSNVQEYQHIKLNGPEECRKSSDRLIGENIEQELSDTLVWMNVDRPGKGTIELISTHLWDTKVIKGGHSMVGGPCWRKVSIRFTTREDTAKTDQCNYDISWAVFATPFRYNDELMGKQNFILPSGEDKEGMQLT